MTGSSCLTVDQRATALVLLVKLRALLSHKEIVGSFSNLMGTSKKRYTVLFQKA
jgi:hypothetical protein